MKKNITIILVGILLIIQIGSFVSIHSLKQEMVRLRNEMNSQYSHQINEIGGIAGNIQSELEQQDNPIQSYDYTIGALDKEKLTAEVTFRVTPKQLKENTAMNLYIDEEKLLMKRVGAIYQVTAPIEVFSYNDPKIGIETDGIETISEFVLGGIKDGIVLEMNPSFTGGSSYTTKPSTGTTLFKIGGDINLDYGQLEKNKVESAIVVMELNEKKVWEQSISDLSKDFAINETFEIKDNEHFLMKVVATDTLGLTYTTVLDYFQQNGDIPEAVKLHNTIITDKTGKIVDATYEQEIE